MKIKEYMSIARLFPLMGVSQLNGEVGERLDFILKHQHGLKTCGSLIESCVIEGSISENEQIAIAKTVYILNQNKWDSLFEFVEAEMKPWIDSITTTITEYGKEVDISSSGEDSYNIINKLAGFESVDFVDDNSEERITTYGKGGKTKHSGQNTITSEKQSKQAERLVDYTLKFWDRYGITRTIIADTLKTIALPLYELED